MAQFPATVVGSQALVVAQIDGANAPVFLDTGAKFNLLTYDAAARLHLKWRTVRTRLPFSGVGGAADTLLALATADVGMGAARIKSAEFIVTSLPKGPAAGFIGLDILAHYDLDYDLPGRVIKLMQPSGCDGVPLAYWARTRPYSAVKFDNAGGSPTVTGYVNGVEIRLSFDTGASTTILDTAAASRAGVTSQSAGATPGGDVYGVGGHSVKTWLVPVRSVKIGDEEIRNSRLRIGKLSLPQLDMVLGTDFFLSHHVYVANSQGSIYFTYDGGPVFDLKSLPGEAR